MEDRKLKILFIALTLFAAALFMTSQFYFDNQTEMDRTPASQNSAPELE